MAALALAGCGEAPEPRRDPDPRPSASVPGEAVSLLPLASADGDALSGELRCGFVVGREPLLLAAADVGKESGSDAVVRTAAGVVTLAGERRGGFAAMERGGEFVGAGFEARLTRHARVAMGTEEVRHVATLAVARGGDERRYDGVWSCGP